MPRYVPPTLGSRVVSTEPDSSATSMATDSWTAPSRGVAVAFRRLVVEHSVLFRIGFQREAVTPELAGRFDEARRTALVQLSTRVERLAAVGGLRGHTPAEATIYFHALCEGLGALELRGMLRPGTAEGIWAASLRALLAGLAVPQERVGGPSDRSGRVDAPGRTAE